MNTSNTTNAVLTLLLALSSQNQAAADEQNWARGKAGGKESQVQAQSVTRATKRADVANASRQRPISNNVRLLAANDQAIAGVNSLPAAASAVTASQVAAAGALDSTLLPPKAKPGECYARVWAAPEYRTASEEVLVSEAASRIEVLPARYETVEETVLVQEASSRLEVAPATYKWVEEQVMVKPATKKLITHPAEYAWEEQQVMVKPAHTIWKKGTGPIQKIDEATGEIMCLVEVPAEFKTVRKRVLKSPARTEAQEIPAQYKTIRKRVVDQPASTRTVEIPAKYDTVRVTKLVEPEKENVIEIPAEFKTVARQELVKDGRMEWREILCETNMTRDKIAQIQRALREKGFDPGRIDGVIGIETIQAVNAFQKDQGLPIDKYLNIATVEALGVNPRD